MRQERSIQILQEILKPREEFTPIPFWFFNDTPDQERIHAQLKDYVEKGVNGLVLHPRIGVPESVPYLSDSYFQAVRTIVQTADTLGMKVVLYDEGMYPSGSAHGMVVAENPDYASKGITLRREPGQGTVITSWTDEEGDQYLVYDFTGGTIRGIHFGEDDGEPGAPKSADILNPQAVDAFIRLTHDRYYEELQEYFGTTVIAFFTDEPCALGRGVGRFREWVPGLEREILERGGSLEELKGLFAGQQNGTTRIYHKLIKQHLREIFYAPLSKWCEQHGIALMGHPAESDDIEEELYFHIPGQDLIMRRVAPETGGLVEKDSVQAKLSADIARLLGRRRNANECFGVCCRDRIPWYFTARDMKWYLNWLGMRGVNLFVPHAFYYSVEGARSEERPPDVGPNNIWWPHYRSFSDYMKRLSYLMTDTEDHAQVAVLCDNNRVPYQEVVHLYEHQVSFRYVPVGLLGGEIPSKLEPQDYHTVVNLLEAQWDAYFPQAAILHNEEEIRHLAERSACVRLEDPSPTLRAVHLSKYGQEFYLFCNEGEETIHTSVTLPGKALPILVDLWNGTWRIAEEAERSGAARDTKEDEATNVSEKAAGRRTDAELFTQAGRAAESVKSRRVALHLEPCQTVLYLPDETGSIRSYGAGEELDPTIPQLISDREDRTFPPIPVELTYTLTERGANTASYTASYEAEEIQGGETITIDGQEMAECYCNGRFEGVSFYAPHRFAIGTCLHVGTNHIKIRFTGNAANQFNDAHLPVGMKKKVETLPK